MENIAKAVAILCFIIQYTYWYIAALQTEKTKPKKKEKFSMVTGMRGLALPLAELTIIIQIIFHKDWIIPHAPIVLAILGAFMTIVGLSICIIARKTLSDNWANAYEYQIKQGQELITKSIYSSIRHPIYLGLTLMLIGGEMVAESYLFISFFAFFIVFYIQGKREEKILLAHFGKKYKEYINHTKMLIPYVL